jgi:hypothetical protein
MTIMTISKPFLLKWGRKREREEKKKRRRAFFLEDRTFFSS